MDSINYKCITYLQLPSESILQILTLKILPSPQKDLLHILVGAFHTEIFVLCYDQTNNSLKILSKIVKACSVIKPGISSIDYFMFDILSNNRLEKYLVTGSFDYRIRMYKVENNLEFKFLGSTTPSNSIINQVNFFFHKESDCLYLLVASDDRLIKIYTIE